jgi:hypothetical protein
VTVLAYAGCFLALAGVAGLGAASGRSWLLRAPLLAATPLLAIAVWWQLSQRDGWPTTGKPQTGSAFVAGVVQSPAPGSAGAIYVWMQPPGTPTPRAYRFPYSLQLERQVNQAAREVHKGAHVGVRAAGAHSKHGGTRPGEPDGGSKLHFYKLPPAAAEVKGHGS